MGLTKWWLNPTNHQFLLTQFLVKSAMAAAVLFLLLTVWSEDHYFLKLLIYLMKAKLSSFSKISFTSWSCIFLRLSYFFYSLSMFCLKVVSSICISFWCCLSYVSISFLYLSCVDCILDLKSERAWPILSCQSLSFAARIFFTSSWSTPFFLASFFICFSSFLTAFSSLDVADFLTSDFSFFSSFLTAFLLSWCLWDFFSFFYSASFGSSFLGSSFSFGDSFGFSSFGFSASLGFSSSLDFSSLSFSSFGFSSLDFSFWDWSLVGSFFLCLSLFGFFTSLGFY